MKNITRFFSLLAVSNRSLINYLRSSFFFVCCSPGLHSAFMNKITVMVFFSLLFLPFTVCCSCSCCHCRLRRCCLYQRVECVTTQPLWLYTKNTKNNFVMQTQRKNAIFWLSISILSNSAVFFTLCVSVPFTSSNKNLQWHGPM